VLFLRHLSRCNQIQGEIHPIAKNIFTLNTCANIVGAQVISHQNEKDMLLAWKHFVLKVYPWHTVLVSRMSAERSLFVQADPDIITGYNIVNFDLPYLLNRAKVLICC